MTIQNIHRSVPQSANNKLKGIWGWLARAVLTRGTWSKTSECWRRYDIPTYQRRGIQLTVRANY